MANLSVTTAWIAFLAIPFAAVLGAMLRRVRLGRRAVRMRPHYALGYAALAFAVVHLMTAGGAMTSADVAGIWIGAGAALSLFLQAFLGASLQAPGEWRVPLRRWHVVAFWSALALALAHVVRDASFLQGMGSA